MEIDYEDVFFVAAERGGRINRCGDGGEEFAVGCLDGSVVLLPLDSAAEGLVVG